MAWTCIYLNIYPQYIEDAGNSIENLMSSLGFTIDQIDEVWKIIKSDVEEYTRGKQITNSVIYSIFNGCIKGIISIRPDLNEDDFDFYVNGLDSNIYYKGEEY